MKIIEIALRMMARSCLLLSLSLSTVQAHHSFGLYDTNTIDLEGTITDVSWRNPHVRITLSVLNEAGEETLWTLEGGASYVLKRRGIEQDLFEVGDVLLVNGRPHTIEESLLLLHNILLDNDKEVLMAGGVESRWSRDIVGQDDDSYLEDAASQNLGLYRTWSRAVLRPITYGESLPYKEGVSREGGAEMIDRLNALAQRCEPTGMPGIMATPYPFQFINRGDIIEVLGFSNNAPVKRYIYINEDLAPKDRQAAGRMGSSVGRWESEKLFVVQTSKIDWPYFDDTMGTPISADAVVMEYFTLSEDQARIDYRSVVEDQALFAEPVTVIDMSWAALGEELIHPTDCSN